MVAGVVTAIVLLVGFAVVLLSAPLRLEIDIERQGQLSTRWRVNGIFGLLDARSWYPKSSRQREPQPRRRATKKRAEHGPRRRSAIALAVVRTPGFLGRVVRLVRDLTRQVKCERFYVDGKFGLDDPADTGVVFGALAPLLIAARASGLQVLCRPMFDESGLQGACELTVRTTPIFLLGVLVAFLCSPVVVRAIVAAVWRTT